MNYTKENYLSDLMEELIENHNFKETTLREIVDVSEEVNSLLSKSGINNSSIKYIALRVFEIMALEFYSEDMTKSDIKKSAEKIRNSEVKKIYLLKRKELLKGIAQIDKIFYETNKEINEELLLKLLKENKSSSKEVSDIILKMINEFNLEEREDIGEDLNIYYREGENDALVKKQEILKETLLKQASIKTFINNIKGYDYNKIIEIFDQENINIEKYKGNYTFSIVKQIIFSEIRE